jgi:hypothetical protein
MEDAGPLTQAITEHLRILFIGDWFIMWLVLMYLALIMLLGAAQLSEIHCDLGVMGT